MTSAFRFQAVSPILSVNDVDEAIAFYRDRLGFALAWAWGEPVEVAAVGRDGIELTLSRRADAKPVGAAHFYLTLIGVDALYDKLSREGVTLVVPLADRPYGMRDFRLADPSGNELSIGEALEEGRG